MSPGIAEALTQLSTPLSDLHPHPANPRRGDVEAIKKSLETFGQVRPIVALPDGTIVAGHHVFYAVQEMGWEEIAAVRPELTEDEARRYLIADNRLAELGGYDQDALAGLLSDIMDDGQLIGTGWEPDEVEDLLAEIGSGEIEPEEFTGDFGDDVDPDDGEPVEPMREIVLMVPADQFDQFSEELMAIKKAYVIDSPTQAIREAIRREAQRAKNG